MKKYFITLFYGILDFIINFSIAFIPLALFYKIFNYNYNLVFWIIIWCLYELRKAYIDVRDKSIILGAISELDKRTGGDKDER